MIYYIQRNEDGRIVALYAGPQPGYAEESLKEDNREVVEFFDKLNAKSELAE